MLIVNRNENGECTFNFLLETSFGLRVLPLPASVRLRVYPPYVHQHWACPLNNLWPIQARITKLRPEVKNTLVKIPIVWELIDFDFQGQV